MKITDFVELSFGWWRLLRSGHNLAFAHSEEVCCTIDIELHN